MSWKLAVAGSTHRTLEAVKALESEPDFSVSWVLTPIPKPVGRQQILTQNPLHLWAETSSLPTILVEKKINSDVQNQILALPRPDILLVVDFGYLVPNWLLELPTQLPLNIHPSALPRWRGSSPGQFVLLNGESKSAVTLMIMDSELDHGPIVEQWPLEVASSWTQTEYYQHSFQLVTQNLATAVRNLLAQKIQPKAQPDLSPTPIAGHLSKNDSYVAWSDVTQSSQTSSGLPQTSELLKTLFLETKSWPIVLERATRAFSPWPGLWTLVPSTKGNLRMKILSSHLNQEKLILDEVQLEGKKPSTWDTLEKTLF